MLRYFCTNIIIVTVITAQIVNGGVKYGRQFYFYESR